MYIDIEELFKLYDNLEGNIDELYIEKKIKKWNHIKYCFNNNYYIHGVFF